MTILPPTPMHCANHPDRETLLRCNRCDKPICVECAVQTPTGYRCKDCVRMQQKKFDTARPLDYLFAFLIAGILSFIGSLLVGFVGFFSLLLAPGVGWVIAEVVRKATGRRRSKPLFQVTAGSAVLGAVANQLPLLVMVLLGYAGAGYVLSLVWPALYAAIVCTTVYARLSGIQLR